MAVADFLIPPRVSHKDTLQLGLIHGTTTKARSSPVQVLNDLIRQLFIVGFPFLAEASHGLPVPLHLLYVQVPLGQGYPELFPEFGRHLSRQSNLEWMTDGWMTVVEWELMEEVSEFAGKQISSAFNLPPFASREAIG